MQPARVYADPPSEYRLPPPHAYIERAVAAAAISAARNSSAEDFLTARYPKDSLSTAVLHRATVLPASTDTSGWASQLVQNAFRNYLTSLTPISAAAELIRRGIPAGFPGAGTATYPQRNGSLDVVPWVEETEPIPVRSDALTTVTIGPRRKVAFISVLSREVAKRMDGEAVVTQMMREETALTLDAALFSTTAASDAAHAGLLNGVSPLTGMSGGDFWAIQSDLTRLAVAVSASGSGQVVFIGSPSAAAALPILAPDIADKVTFLPSTAVADSRIVAVDPVSVLYAIDQQPDISASLEGVVHMSDAPLEIVADNGTVADPVRSLYQTDAIGIRVMADFAWAKRRSGAVAYINDASWLPA